MELNWKKWLSKAFIKHKTKIEYDPADVRIEHTARYTLIMTQAGTVWQKRILTANVEFWFSVDREIFERSYGDAVEVEIDAVDPYKIIRKYAWMFVNPLSWQKGFECEWNLVLPERSDIYQENWL